MLKGVCQSFSIAEVSQILSVIDFASYDSDNDANVVSIYLRRVGGMLGVYAERFITE